PARAGGAGRPAAAPPAEVPGSSVLLARPSACSAIDSPPQRTAAPMRRHEKGPRRTLPEKPSHVDPPGGSRPVAAPGQGLAQLLGHQAHDGHHPAVLEPGGPQDPDLAYHLAAHLRSEERRVGKESRARRTTER